MNDMMRIAGLPTEERRALFTETGVQMGLPPFHVEKDFWVCWVLAIFFGDLAVGPHLTFRGGTSLSKAWGIIERFSEDIDLAMSRDWVGNADDPGEPGVTSSEKERRLQTLRRECREMIESRLVPLLENAAGKNVKDSFQVTVEPLEKARDPFCIYFNYPVAAIEAPSDYNLPAVKIELSGRADGWPMEDRVIIPYVSAAFPDLVGNTRLSLSCVRPERTFWEKAALVHEQNVRPVEKPIGPRQSRHLYDLVRIWETDVAKVNGFQKLFDGVKAHRRTYFDYKWVNYERLSPSDLCLVPPKSRLPEWRADYEKMQAMFFSAPPLFDETLRRLRLIESFLST